MVWGWLPLFAEDTVGPGGWAAVILAVLTTGSTVILAVINARHKNRQEHESTAIGQWKEFTERQEKVIDALNTRIDRQTEEIAKSRVAELACREEVAELRAGQAILYDLYMRTYHEASRLGAKLPSPPPAPENKPQRAAVAEASFTLRNQQHEAGLARKESEEIQSQRPNL